MISVRIDDEFERRLDFLAQQTGRSKSFYVREAIISKIEEFEDIYLSEIVLNNIKSGKEKLISHEDFWNEMGD